MAALRNDARHITCGVSHDLPHREPASYNRQDTKILRVPCRHIGGRRNLIDLLYHKYIAKQSCVIWHCFLKERIILSCFWQALSILETSKPGDTDSFFDSTMYRRLWAAHQLPGAFTCLLAKP